MAGILLNIVPKRVFDFSSVRAYNFTQTLTVVERLDISQDIDAVLILRVHALINLGTPQNLIVFSLYPDGFTEDDPGMQFVGTSFGASITVNDAAATLYTSASTVRGHYARLLLANTLGDSSGTNAIITASVDLCLGSPDDTAMTHGI